MSQHGEGLSHCLSFATRHNTLIRVRPYRPGDEDFVMSLAPRLLTGVPPWRDPERWLVAVYGWITEDFKKHGKQAMLFIAENEHGEPLGFAGVADGQHFSGEKLAYLGELAVSEAAEGQGAGQALVHTCEQWARQQGYSTLVLDTSSVKNERALNFYEQLGFQQESVKLAKLL